MAPRRRRNATFRAQREIFFLRYLIFQNSNSCFRASVCCARAHVPHDFPKNRKKIFAATTPHLDSFSITRTPWPNVTRRFAALHHNYQEAGLGDKWMGLGHVCFHTRLISGAIRFYFLPQGLNAIQHYFEDSYKNVVSFFAKEEKISVSELKEIISIIEKNQKNKS